MPYCVNCGVELSNDTKSCPLCSTPVYHPDASLHVEENQLEKPFSDRVVIPKSSRRRFTAYIITVIMLIPNIICILSNLMFSRGTYWSFYILTSSLLFWVLCVFPFYTKKLRPYLMWAFDSVAVSAYIYFFFAMGNNEIWYYKCVLPTVSAVSLFSLIFIIWCKKKQRDTLTKIIHFLSDSIICDLIIGAVISYYYSSFVPLRITLIVAVSVFVFLVFLMYSQKSEKMKAWLTRNFFTE